MHEVWSFDYQQRIFAGAGRDAADRRAGDRGARVGDRARARAIVIRPAPVIGLRGSRSVRWPEFDPFWGAGPGGGHARLLSRELSAAHRVRGFVEPQTTDNAFVWSPFKAMALGHREIEDTVSAMICHERSRVSAS